MRRKLWPEENSAELETELPGLAERSPPYFGLIAEDSAGRPLGFAEIAVRSYAEGTSGPAAYLEGIWVDPEERRRGVARALLETAEQWARDEGLSHFGSDAAIDNALSHAWHSAVGFRQVERLVVFGKSLR